MVHVKKTWYYQHETLTCSKNMKFQWYVSKNNCNTMVHVIKHGINEKHGITMVNV